MIKGFRIEIWGLCVKVVVCGVAVVCMIYCSSGVYVMFKGLFEGLSGVRMTGKTGKSGVSGEVWVFWVGILILYIYLHAYNSSNLPKISIFNFMYIYTARNSQI